MAATGWKKGLAVVSSIAAVGLLLAGCGASNNSSSKGGSQSTNAKPIEGGSITIDGSQNFKDLDPAKAYDTASYEFVTEMYDTLVTYQGATSNIIPHAATSWEVSSDGTTYTFHLRHDMKFWNGDPVTAQSFIDEFQRVLSNSVSSGGEGFLDPIVEGSTAYNQGKAKTVTGLSAPDQYTLKIQLTKAEPFFLYVLAMPFFSAVDQSWINKVGNKAFDSTSPMGSGPFELQSSNISPNQVTMTKNPNYWMKDQNGNQIPYLNSVTVNINANQQVDALDFEKGNIAFLGNMQAVPSTAWPTFISSPKLHAMQMNAPANATYYLGLNNNVKPFNNVLVRQAVEYAIDKDKIIKLLNNRFQVANQPLPPGIKGYMNPLPADATYSYNPAKAKQLLTQAGFPNGFSTTLYDTNSSDSIKIDQSIQNDLAKVGIKVTLENTTWATFLAENEKGNVQGMFQLAWIEDFPDASDFLNTLFNSSESPLNNSTMYNNPQVNSWLNQAQTDTNEAQRLQLYDQVTEQVMKDADWVPEYYGAFNYAVQPWVHGFYINPQLPDPLQFIWVDKNHQ